MTSDKNPFEDSELTTIIVVNDIEKSKSFYLDGLGATFHRSYGGTSMVLQFLNHWMLLVTAGEPTEDKPNIAFEPAKTSNSVNHSFTIRVKNCQETYEILSDRGIEFITPPYDWGAEVRCFFKDPDNHLFEISEYRG